MGLLVNLIYSTLEDVKIFTVFFLSVILTMAMLFRVLGIKLSADDYPGMGNALAIFTFTFENALGDAVPPDVSFWKNKH